MCSVVQGVCSALKLAFKARSVSVRKRTPLRSTPPCTNLHVFIVPNSLCRSCTMMTVVVVGLVAAFVAVVVVMVVLSIFETIGPFDETHSAPHHL